MKLATVKRIHLHSEIIKPEEEVAKYNDCKKIDPTIVDPAFIATQVAVIDFKSEWINKDKRAGDVLTLGRMPKAALASFEATQGITKNFDIEENIISF